MEHTTRTEPNNRPLTVLQFKHVLEIYNRDSDKAAAKVHPFFEDLAFNTVKNYKHGSKVLLESMNEVCPLEFGGQNDQLSPAHAQAVVDSLIAERGPGAARCAVASMGSILSYMILYTNVSTSTYNAFDYVRIPKGEMIGAWTKEQIDQHLSADPRAPNLLRTLTLLLYETGQRLSDVVWLSHGNSRKIIINEKETAALFLKQQKTGKDIVIPVSNVLANELGLALRFGNPPFLGRFVENLSENNVRYFYQKECRRLGIEPLPLHGLRKSAVIRMIEAGATVFEVMAVTGHKSVSSLKHYMDGYSQMESARRAFEKAGMV
ncbi:MAG: hypothetical protein B7Z37_23530 [Verrucomicrobia bacterium 12-59-8]|nr:MAG: hypothetical protein B7Z37_23530 [Verrucomicrobia bacterium 12-59-8]